LKSYDACDVDVCNGMMVGDHYSYVSTFFHPYIMGCFGPGDSPNLAQGCSTKPRNCNVPTGSMPTSNSGSTTNSTGRTPGGMTGSSRACNDGSRP